MNLVTICTSFYLAEAELTRSRLEAAGFHPFLANENAATWIGGVSTATLLGIEVPETEVADAKEFLDTPATPAE
jgi:Putative prokaryotic signal transducing protein